MANLNGVVYTKKWVVDLILDIVGYTMDKPLWEQVIVEPSCGNGSFLEGIVERLLQASTRANKADIDVLEKCIIGYDLDPFAVENSQHRVEAILRKFGIANEKAKYLAYRWIKNGDFLLSENIRSDYVVGNPPYLRATEIPSDTRKMYCKMCSTMTMGSDIFVGFFQKGLESINNTGALCFICADRWMQNQYGKKLRALISKEYHIDAIFKMHDVDAFESNVSAYPAIVRIDKGCGRIKYAECGERFCEKNAEHLKSWYLGSDSEYSCVQFSAAEIAHPIDGGIIPLASPKKVGVITELTHRFPALEKTGVKIGIGIATGRDNVFITYDSNLIEKERLLPVFNMKDWRKGKGYQDCWLVNPWNKDGTLVELSEYPRLKSYLESHKNDIAARSVARHNESSWYRTIDKVNWDIVGTPMLLFPDMASKSSPVYCDGSKYPCHNCYWLTSEKWDIKVLGGLLMSQIVEMFVDALGVKMRGGTMRFQAQYLRLIHVPPPEDISDETAALLRTAFEKGDRDAANNAAMAAYGIKEKIA